MSTEKLAHTIEALISSDSFDMQKYQELKAQLDSASEQLENKKLQLDWIDSLAKMNPDLYNKLLKYCKIVKENPASFVFNAMNKILDEFNQPAIEKVDSADYEEWIQKEAENVFKKYNDQYKSNNLVKSDQYIVSDETEFVGHSIVDAKPIYNIKSKTKKKGIHKIPTTKVKYNEVGLKIVGDENREIYFEKDKRSK